MFRSDTIAAVIEGLQIRTDLSGGLLLFKCGNNAFPLAVRIASKPQHMVYIRLGKRKSRGCMRYILCFINILDLFRFGEEQV